MQFDLDGGFIPWESALIEYSPVGMNIGWHDGGYYTTGINQLNSAQFGGSGNFFMYASDDTGTTWQDMTNEYQGATPNAPDKGDLWTTGGLNVTGVYDVKVHPANHNDIYVASADIHGSRSIDHGQNLENIA